MSKKLLVYISGPITGMPNGNRDAFNAEAERLIEKGFSVFNPQDIPRPDRNLEGAELWRYYMKICVAALPQCDALVQLPDWQFSSGARWERDIAVMLGIRVLRSNDENMVPL